MNLAIAREDKLMVKSLLKTLDSRDREYIDILNILKQGSIFLLLFQNILEFPISSVGIDSKNKKNTVNTVAWLSKVLKTKQSLESCVSQNPGII